MRFFPRRHEAGGSPLVIKRVSFLLNLSDLISGGSQQQSISISSDGSCFHIQKVSGFLMSLPAIAV